MSAASPDGFLIDAAMPQGDLPLPSFKHARAHLDLSPFYRALSPTERRHVTRLIARAFRDDEPVTWGKLQRTVWHHLTQAVPPEHME